MDSRLAGRGLPGSLRSTVLDRAPGWRSSRPLPAIGPPAIAPEQSRACPSAVRVLTLEYSQASGLYAHDRRPSLSTATTLSTSAGRVTTHRRVQGSLKRQLVLLTQT